MQTSPASFLAIPLRICGQTQVLTEQAPATQAQQPYSPNTRVTSPFQSVSKCRISSLAGTSPVSIDSLSAFRNRSCQARGGRYRVVKSRMATGRSHRLEPEELAGTDYISFILHRLANGEALQKP